MLYVLRKCESCGGMVDITDGDYLSFSTTEKTCYICKGCLYVNPTFKHMATTYALERAEEITKPHKEDKRSCKS